VRGLKRRGSDDRRSVLSASMLSFALAERGIRDADSADTRAGTYTYNDAGSTRRDHEGRVFAVPKHFPAIDGARTEVNLLKDLDPTVIANWGATGSGSLDSYDGGGVYTCSGLSGGTTHSVSITALSGVDIEGRTFKCVGYVRGTGADVGQKIRIAGNRTSGGTTIYQSSTITLTADWVAVTTPAFTGVSSNAGVDWGISGTVTDSASGCEFKDPTLVEVTSKANQTAPLPIPVDVPDEYARELLSTLSGTGWTDNSDGTYTHSSGTTGLDQAVTLKTGRKMVAEVIITGRTAGTVTPKFTGGSGVDGSAVSADSWQVLTVGSGNTTFSLVPTTDFDGTVTVSLKEAAPGVQQFERTNANTVSAGVITEVEGELLSPWHWETVRSGSKKTIRHKVKDWSTPWSAGDSVVANERRLPTDWMTNYNRQLGFYADGPGTTGGTEPDWSTATEPGDTVSDNGITWTAFWCTIRGLTIEPAATNNVTDSDSFSSVTNENCTITAGNAIAPDGSRTATLVVGSGAGTHRLKQTQSINSGVAWTVSVYCRDNGDDETMRCIVWNTTTGNIADIRLQPSNGAITETIMTDVLDYTVESLIDNWYRLSVTVVPSSTQTYTVMWYPTVQTSVTEGMYLWGAQINSGHYTSRIKTTAGTVTRTTQEAAMTYPIENFDNDNFLSLVDMSFGVALQDVSSGQSLISTHATDTTASLVHVSGAGKMQTSDGSGAFPGAAPTDVTNEIFRTATHHKDGGYFGMRWFRATTAGAEGSWASSSFDGAYSVGRGNIALCPSITIPVTFHGIRFMPGLDIQTAADVAQYHSFDDLRYV
jgi:hypothetical protein